MTINCKGNLIDLSTPKVMGVLNSTPDSFYDGGRYASLDASLRQAEKMLGDGATFIDVGGYSTRPNAPFVTEEIEKKRILPLIQRLCKEFPDILISVDTFRSSIAKLSIEHGASMVNDISGGTLDPLMFSTIGSLKVPYVLMHILGTPQTMQDNPIYDNVTRDIMFYFSDRLRLLRNEQVHDLILDLGFGFGKTIAQNYELLNHLDAFKQFELPILTGVSRKSMLYKPLDIDADSALNATTVCNTIALLKGSSILRVHDVKEAIEAIKILALTNA